MAKKDRSYDKRKKHVRTGKSAAEIHQMRAIVARVNGQKGGRPLGSRQALPTGSLQALRSMKFNVKEKNQGNEAACDIAAIALEAQVRVVCGKVNSRKAPSILKAAAAIRAEICEPVVQKTESNVTLSVAGAVAQAAQKLQALRVPAAQQEIDVSGTPNALRLTGGG